VPAVAFRLRQHEQPALEVRVNFGIFAGRHATPAEIDDLARALREEVDEFTIVAEERHEFAGNVEASLHQVVIEIPSAAAAADVDGLSDRIVASADRWAQACVASRHVDIAGI
jgi:hypothetical protein